jgi:excisionase family DNA binding protein
MAASSIHRPRSRRGCATTGLPTLLDVTLDEQPRERPILGVSCAEAARILGVHEVTVSKYVRAGLLHRRVPKQHDGLDRTEVEKLALDQWPPGHPYWVRTREAAELLGVSVGTVKRYARDGRLPFIERDGRRYYRRHQLEVIADARDARLSASLGQQ